MTQSIAADPLLQFDYGGFNPRFLGISLFYDSVDNYEAVRAYLLDQRGPEFEGLHGISLRSVLDHEARHYVDFLLSSYSAATFRLRLQAMLNGVQALSLVRGMEGAVLPVPIVRWALSDQDQRTRVEAQWGELLGLPATAVPVPFFSSDQLRGPLPAGIFSITEKSRAERFDTFVNATARTYQAIDEMTQGFGARDELPHLRPAYLHEVSALSTQIAAIYHGQGVSEALDFIGFLAESELPQAWAFRAVLILAEILEGIWSGDEEPLSAVRRVQSLTTWVLLGDFVTDRQQACPASRFRALVEALSEDPKNRSWTGDIEDQDSLERMWDFWDARVGITPWRDALSSHLKWGESAVRQYGAYAEDEPGIGRLALGAIEMVARDQRTMVEAMLDDPRLFAVAQRYVQAPQGVIPPPDGRLEFRFQGFTTDPLREGTMPLIRTAKDGEEYTTGVAYTTGGADPKRKDELKLKLDIEQAIQWCDLVFSRLSVPAHAAGPARASLEDLTQKRVLNLI